MKKNYIGFVRRTEIYQPQRVYYHFLKWGFHFHSLLLLE